MFIKGVCLDEGVDDGCPETFNPVCGVNGTVERGFPNDCRLKGEAKAALALGQTIKKIHNGPCTSKNDNYFISF